MSRYHLISHPLISTLFFSTSSYNFNHSPHPGNLLRTTDGRLCVLDWGMTLEVPKDLQYGLLDFIAHINAEDFESLPEDFVNLGFTPPNKLEQVRHYFCCRIFRILFFCLVVLIQRDFRYELERVTCTKF